MNFSVLVTKSLLESYKYLFSLKKTEKRGVSTRMSCLRSKRTRLFVVSDLSLWTRAERTQGPLDTKGRQLPMERDDTY